VKKLSFMFIILTACGTSSSGNESVGQIKKVVNKTPFICPNYTEVDISLGIVRNGIGSMSHEDLVLALDNSAKSTIDKLKKAAEDGSVVKVTYDVQRVSPCWPDHRLDPAIVIEATPARSPVTPE
jgi:hypothetical protein